MINLDRTCDILSAILVAPLLLLLLLILLVLLRSFRVVVDDFAFAAAPAGGWAGGRVAGRWVG